MFVIVRTERPRDEVAPFILPKISAATGGVGCICLKYFYNCIILHVLATLRQWPYLQTKNCTIKFNIMKMEIFR